MAKMPAVKHPSPGAYLCYYPDFIVLLRITTSCPMGRAGRKMRAQDAVSTAFSLSGRKDASGRMRHQEGGGSPMRVTRFVCFCDNSLFLCMFLLFIRALKQQGGENGGFHACACRCKTLLFT